MIREVVIDAVEMAIKMAVEKVETMETNDCACPNLIDNCTINYKKAGGRTGNRIK